MVIKQCIFSHAEIVHRTTTYTTDDLIMMPLCDTLDCFPQVSKDQPWLLFYLLRTERHLLRYNFILFFLQRIHNSFPHQQGLLGFFCFVLFFFFQKSSRRIIDMHGGNTKQELVVSQFIVQLMLVHGTQWAEYDGAQRTG